MPRRAGAAAVVVGRPFDGWEQLEWLQRMRMPLLLTWTVVDLTACCCDCDPPFPFKVSSTQHWTKGEQMGEGLIGRGQASVQD